MVISQKSFVLNIFLMPHTEFFFSCLLLFHQSFCCFRRHASVIVRERAALFRIFFNKYRYR